MFEIQTTAAPTSENGKVKNDTEAMIKCGSRGWKEGIKKFCGLVLCQPIYRHFMLISTFVFMKYLLPRDYFHNSTDEKNWRSRFLSNLPMVTKVVNDGNGIQGQLHLFNQATLISYFFSSSAVLKSTVPDPLYSFGYMFWAKVICQTLCARY